MTLQEAKQKFTGKTVECLSDFKNVKIHDVYIIAHNYINEIWAYNEEGQLVALLWDGINEARIIEPSRLEVLSQELQDALEFCNEHESEHKYAYMYGVLYSAVKKATKVIESELNNLDKK